MIWETFFLLANLWAIAAWAALILLPRGPLSNTLIFYGGIGLLCLAYTALVLILLGGLVDPVAGAGGGDAGFTSIEGVRAIFASDGGLVAGWTHYLALDLFAGLWIAKDADAKRFSRALQAPVLLLTFIAGPAGLLVWLFIREPAARRAAPRRNLP